MALPTSIETLNALSAWALTATEPHVHAPRPSPATAHTRKDTPMTPATVVTIRPAPSRGGYEIRVSWGDTRSSHTVSMYHGERLDDLIKHVVQKHHEDIARQAIAAWCGGY